MELKLCSPSLSLCSSSSSSSASSSSSSYACRPWLMQKTQKSCLLSFRSFPSLKIPSKIERYGHRRLLEITRIFTTETSTLDTSLSSPPTIRKLVLLRHGKSSWSDPSVKGLFFYKLIFSLFSNCFMIFHVCCCSSLDTVSLATCATFGYLQVTKMLYYVGIFW